MSSVDRIIELIDEGLVSAERQSSAEQGQPIPSPLERDLIASIDLDRCTIWTIDFEGRVERIEGVDFDAWQPDPELRPQMMAFDRVLTRDEIDAVESYFRDRWDQ